MTLPATIADGLQALIEDYPSSTPDDRPDPIIAVAIAFLRGWQEQRGDDDLDARVRDYVEPPPPIPVVNREAMLEILDVFKKDKHGWLWDALGSLRDLLAELPTINVNVIAETKNVAPENRRSVVECAENPVLLGPSPKDVRSAVGEAIARVTEIDAVHRAGILSLVDDFEANLREDSFKNALERLRNRIRNLPPVTMNIDPTDTRPVVEFLPLPELAKMLIDVDTRYEAKSQHGWINGWHAAMEAVQSELAKIPRIARHGLA